MQCVPESLRELFATVVQVLAAVSVVSVAVETLWRRPFARELFTYYWRSLSSLVVSSNVDLFAVVSYYWYYQEVLRVMITTTVTTTRLGHLGSPNPLSLFVSTGLSSSFLYCFYCYYYYGCYCYHYHSYHYCY
jgi:hypothetical protein